jgi:hypothetical protein
MAVLRIARVRLSVHIIQDILSGKWEQWAGRSSAPDDLEVLGVEQPPFAVGQWFYVICRSDSFRPVLEGAELPEIPPFEFTRIEGIPPCPD